MSLEACVLCGTLTDMLVSFGHPLAGFACRSCRPVEFAQAVAALRASSR